jgi:hypothetical protein
MGNGFGMGILSKGIHTLRFPKRQDVPIPPSEINDEGLGKSKNPGRKWEAARLPYAGEPPREKKGSKKEEEVREVRVLSYSIHSIDIYAVQG